MPSNPSDPRDALRASHADFNATQAARPEPQPVTDFDRGHGLMDAFHLPATMDERRALRRAAEAAVGPGGA